MTRHIKMRSKQTLFHGTNEYCHFCRHAFLVKAKKGVTPFWECTLHVYYIYIYIRPCTVSNKLSRHDSGTNYVISKHCQHVLYSGYSTFPPWG